MFEQRRPATPEETAALIASLEASGLELEDAEVSEIATLTELGAMHTVLGLPDARPGADGHAGIVGLHTGSPVQRKSWRRRLARLGSGDVRWFRQEPSGTTSPP